MTGCQLRSRGPQDLFKWGPQVVEGIFMLYLGLIHLNWSNTGTGAGRVTDTSLQLIHRRRERYDLPSFKHQSLNVAWSLNQARRGPAYKVLLCGNDTCQRPYHKDGIMSGNPFACSKFHWENGVLLQQICDLCFKYAEHNKGRLPSRLGNSNGTYNNVRRDDINTAWFVHYERRCYNEAANA